MRTKIWMTAALLTALGLGSAGTPMAAPAAGTAPCPGAGGGPAGGACSGGAGAGVGTDRCMMMLKDFDTNGDGKITAEEFRAGHDGRFAAMDADHDGKVTSEEFAAAAKPARDTRHQQMFKRMDTNGDGVLTQDEVDSRAQTHFARLDANGDKVVTMDELQQSKACGHPRGTGPAAGRPMPMPKSSTPGEASSPSR